MSKRLTLILLSSSIILLLLISFASATPKTKLSDGFRVNSEHITSGGGIIQDPEEYTVVSGKGGSGKAVRLKHGNFIIYENPYNADINKGWVEIWFKPTENRFGILDFDTPSASYAVFMAFGDVHFEATVGGFLQLRHSTNAKLNKWNHLIVSWNSNQDKVAIYLNGEKRSRTFTADMPPPGPSPEIHLSNHWFYGPSEKAVYDKLKIVKGGLTENHADFLYQRFKDA